ncbi:MAG: RdgB/HAM1 family non-canonical purine NTP pyrophosphatase [Pseudomonadales bacterium]
MDIVLATANENKLSEMKALLPARFNLVSQRSLGVNEANETGLSFVENAIIKARHATSASGLPAIADDSGLEVDYLSGAPGIYSSRYAGADATDAENNEKLLKDMQTASAPHRRARFRCVIVMMEHDRDPMPTIACGTWEGEILTSPRGANGFGYDPLFYVSSLTRTVAELDRETKNLLSHRGQAIRELAGMLSQHDK